MAVAVCPPLVSAGPGSPSSLAWPTQTDGAPTPQFTTVITHPKPSPLIMLSLFLGVKTNAGSTAVQLNSDFGRKDFSHKRWTNVRSVTSLALNKKSVVKKEGESIETRNKGSGNKTRPASGEDKPKEFPNLMACTLLASFNGAFCFFRLNNKKRLIGSGNVFTSSPTHHHRNSHLLCSLLSLCPAKN